ncbi:MAG: 30S ribosomal protein S21 [Chloroflexota bacterium]
MSEVRAQGNEGFESLLKRFAKKVQQDGILSEIRKGEHYEKPSVQKKRKAAAKKRKSIRSSRPKNSGGVN